MWDTAYTTRECLEICVRKFIFILKCCFGVCAESLRATVLVCTTFVNVYTVEHIASESLFVDT